MPGCEGCEPPPLPPCDHTEEQHLGGVSCEAYETRLWALEVYGSVDAYEEAMQREVAEHRRLAHFVPPPRLVALAKHRPEIEWLCSLPREDRYWWVGDPDRLARLMDIYVDVSEEHWLTLLT